MPTKKKRKTKPLVGTWYALRHTRTGRYYRGGWIGNRTVAFPMACLLNERADFEATVMAYPGEYEIVPVRCRPLTSASRNRKRTR